MFGYDARFVTLFHQPGSVSRFVRQRLLLNTAPVLERFKGVLRTKGIKDVRADPEGFTFCYFYGLLVHKLGHFHDIVHGTRHDFMVSHALSFTNKLAPHKRQTLCMFLTPLTVTSCCVDCGVCTFVACSGQMNELRIEFLEPSSRNSIHHASGQRNGRRGSGCEGSGDGVMIVNNRPSL